MARYREKSPEDIRWNSIRRRLTRELDTLIADWREEQMNTILTAAWDEFTKSLESGEKLAIEANYKDWVTQALEQSVSIPNPER